MAEPLAANAFVYLRGQAGGRGRHVPAYNRAGQYQQNNNGRQRNGVHGQNNAVAVRACGHLSLIHISLEELKTRQPEPKFPFRARVVLAGSEIDDPEFTKLLEMCGAMVVADRYCFGSFPSREEIEIRDGETAYDAIGRHYLHWNQCARFMDGGKIDQRHDQLERLVKDYHACLLYTSRCV